MFKSIIRWIFSHKLFVFIYIPMTVCFGVVLYVFLIYMSWSSDKSDALDKLSRYKRLIDKTEEMRRGMQFSVQQFSGNKKVVSIPTRIYDRNGEIIGEFFDQKREIVPYKYIPETLVNAVIASEDRDFKKHEGINYKGIMRAMLVNLKNLRLSQGGSTVTQQLAKVLFTDMERSIKRKVYEAFCAKAIENRYDKQDIMSMYLNLIYFGNSSYGVESTSRMYFGKSVRDLTDAECAMIVATISNPMHYSPLNNLNNSVVKTKRILQSLVDAGYMEQKKADYEYKRLINNWDIEFDKKGKAVESEIGTFLYSSYRINRAPFYNNYVFEILKKKFGEEIVKKGGLAVYTTIDASKQDVALRALRESIDNQRKYHEKKGQKERAENIQGAFVSLDPYTGEILSYVGGYAFTKNNQLDSVSQIRRQPGSSFKPIVYTAALENKDITPSTMMVDEKTTFKGKYSPSNYSGKYSGKIIIREALRRSINVIAVKVLEKTGYSKIFDYVQKSLDLSDNEMENRFNKTLSLSLGTYEISPLENATLHSVIVNGGDFIKPYGIRYVKDYDGNVIWNNEEEVANYIKDKREEYGKIIDPPASAIMVSMLKGVLEPGGTASWIKRVYKITYPAAGKTGTSTNWNDAWFVGYTPDFVSACWIGNRSGSVSLGRGRAGGVLAAPVWGKYVSYVYRHEKPEAFKIPEQGLTKQTICLESGKVPVAEGVCPQVSKDELFYEGTEPGEYCDIHKKKEEKTEGEAE